MSKLILSENKEIIIYGAGYYGDKIYWYLKLIGLLDLVLCVVVSDGEYHEETLHGIPIYELSQKKDVMANSQVIIAISPKHSEEIAKNLYKNGIGDVICISYDFTEKLTDEFTRICSQHSLKRNKILFDVNNGLGYMCNAKYIAEKLIDTGEDVEIVWSITEIAINHFPAPIRTVDRNSAGYIEEISTSGIIVCNTTMNVPFIKRSSQYIINTWHGIGPFKRVGVKHNGWSLNNGWTTAVRRWCSITDLMIAASDHCPEVYRESLCYKGEIVKWGYARNDVFFRDKAEIRDRVYRWLGIDKDVSIAIYAPTYRVDIELLKEASAFEKYNLRLEDVVKSLEARYKRKFVSVYRMHQIIHRNSLDDGYENYGIDATLYPDMQELLVAADVLITDWSSSIWDFSLARRQGKRVFLYQNDIERATELNGFYMPPDELPFPKGRTTEELCRVIETYDEEQYMRDADSFFEKYGSYDDGHASERVVERIMDVIHHPEKYGKA